MHRLRQSLLRSALGSALLVSPSLVAQDATPTDDATVRTTETREQLERVQREIDRLESELAGLKGRERGILGDIARLDSESRLRQRELEEAELRLGSVNADIGDQEKALGALEEAQRARSSYLSFRLREVYKAGPGVALERLIGGADSRDYWRGARYASYLSARDSRVLGAWRTDQERVESELAALRQSQRKADSVRTDLSRAKDSLEQSRRQRQGILGRVRKDQELHQGALEELAAAALALTRLVEAVESGPAPSDSALDVRKFKGLLERPVDGRVSAGFGRVVHPQFGTEVPHPGWDVEAEFGEDIRSVFDGRVVYAEWMRGYGLTAIIDHGSGVLSIYAHASVLLVQRGERVERGQSVGKVGDTGSLKGSLLYFELRVDGRPVDPRAWLRSG